MRVSIGIVAMAAVLAAWSYFVIWFIKGSGKKKCWQVFVDYAILKPIWFWLAVQIVVGLFHKEWAGSAMLAGVCFAIGFIGQALYPKSKCKDLITGKAQE
jgi:hypothetical protein